MNHSAPSVLVPKAGSAIDVSAFQVPAIQCHQCFPSDSLPSAIFTVFSSSKNERNTHKPGSCTCTQMLAYFLGCLFQRLANLPLAGQATCGLSSNWLAKPPVPVCQSSIGWPRYLCDSLPLKLPMCQPPIGWSSYLCANLPLTGQATCVPASHRQIQLPLC
jgi:hypothetical protein